MPKLSEILGDTYKSIPEDIQKKYKDIDLVDSSEYVSNDTYNQTKKERDDYKKTVGDRDKQIKDLEPLAKDNEDLKTKLTDLQTKNKEDLDKQEAEYKKQVFNIALESKLATVGAKNPRVLKGLLDLDKLTLDDNGNFIGLKEQVDAIKKSDDYLFEKEIKGSGHFGGAPSGGAPAGEENPQDGALSLGEKLAKRKAESLKAPEQLEKFIRR
ncbi:phage scaffolding protein [Clostridium luticellarii]|uniref:Phage minor structural protein GP20 n=1 Tax=Clostridium luticellarii TaxID=1691940 RepID=A0A2T0BLJ7_9CLOT|nr:phage scaffolding protein [Clostridium luticellarii]PRR84751.1 Phage minor structural protein GP20 [Clostridium luticellarii]